MLPVPHTPRRSRTQGAADAGLTPGRIADAMERARALRSTAAIDPTEVRCVPLAPTEAASRTKGRAVLRAWTDAGLAAAPKRSPWCLVGWLRHEHGRDATDPLKPGVYDRTWEVWLHLDDDRVWLRPSRR